jgi:hypothetical protein
MDDRYTPIASDPPDVTDAAGRVIARPHPAQGPRDPILHEEIEVWVNEGGAGDEPGP